MVKPISIFISYAHKDAGFREELQQFLIPFIRKQTIMVWSDKDIDAGEKWDAWIKKKIKESQIILFLVSQDFLASKYITDIEIRNAYNNNKLILIPVILRPIVISHLELNAYQAVPTDPESITEWKNRDAAWVDVTKALERVFNKINGPGQTKGFFSKTLERVNTTDKLVMGFIVLLLSFSIVMFGYGIIATSRFHIFASFLGMGIGLVGYFTGRRSLAYQN
jgi:hypothetical protein